MCWVHVEGGAKYYMVHKAYTLAETKSFSLNSDGTTNFQKKLGVAVNGMVPCLSEVPDGSAEYD